MIYEIYLLKYNLLLFLDTLINIYININIFKNNILIIYLIFYNALTLK
jgi:hypothetical protein